MSGSASSEVQSRSSRASSPDELTPTLCSDQCYVGVTSQPLDSPGLMDTTTQHNTENIGTCNYKFYLNF